MKSMVFASYKNIVLAVLFVLVCFCGACFGAEGKSAVGDGDYAGSLSCKQCHEKFHELWAPSWHGLAMQPYTNKLGAEELSPHKDYIQGKGKSFRAVIKKDEALVSVKSDEGIKDYPIVYVLGGKNVYYFLTRLERGRFQVLPLAYDVNRKEWFDTTASAVRHFDGASDEAIDWMDTPLTFNTSCFSCHISQLSPNYDLKTDTYETQWAEPGINCETCHGPSGEHVRQFQKAQGKKEQPKELHLVSTKNFSVEQVDGMCGPCHAKMRPVTKGFVPGEKYFDHYDLVALENLDFYPDGRDLGENYTFTGWMMNPCYKSGKLDCMHCHTSSGRDRFAGDKANDACLPCHEEHVKNPAAHSHHKPDSEGSKCKTCHMPKTEFARMLRHDHSFRAPTPKTTIAHKSPNACNICHTDKTPKWADEWAEKWYGNEYQKKTVYFAKLIDEARKNNWARLDEMIKYITSKDRDAVVATSLIRLLETCPDQRKWDAVFKAVKDRSPLVRAAAAGSLSGNGSEKSIDLLIAATADKMRVVRTQAAYAISTFPPQMISAEQKSKAQKAILEYLASLTARPDDAASHYNIGNFYSNQGYLEDAVKSYETSARLRDDMIMPLVNASIIYARLGKTEQAEKSLRKAEAIDPNNAEMNFNLGLLLAEKSDLAGAEKCMRRALKANPDFAEAAFNLGVMISQKNPTETIKLCKKAYRLRPNNNRYGYTLAFYLNQSGQVNAAEKVLLAIITRPDATADAYSFLGMIYTRQGKTAQAAEVYRKAMQNENLPMQQRQQFNSMLRAFN
ncbi:MAG: tetratricopeptide repeat protein [Phycisphaerae bacterium]|nr:tetratricopeptide repeat protein [Phycisphaerae bacterium]